VATEDATLAPPVPAAQHLPQNLGSSAGKLADLAWMDSKMA
jgi:hypothetical protein